MKNKNKNKDSIFEDDFELTMSDLFEDDFELTMSDLFEDNIDGIFGNNNCGFGSSKFESNSPFSSIGLDTDKVTKTLYMTMAKDMYKLIHKRLKYNLNCIELIEEIAKSNDGLYLNEQNNSKYAIEFNITYKKYELSKIEEGEQLERYKEELKRLGKPFSTTEELASGIISISNKKPKAFLVNRVSGRQVLVIDKSIINYIQ